MVTIHDAGGAVIGEITLSSKMIAALETGGEITLMFHTPQLLRGLLGESAGSVVLRKEGERIVAGNPQSVRKYCDLQKAIAAARRIPDAVAKNPG